ncbi:MAG: KAP family P-loop NTPase fold protein [Candidatus Woesearchaeota archaeon]
MDSQESKKKPKDQFKDILGRIYYFINSNDFKIITGIIIAYYLYFELNGIKLINNYLVEHVLKHLDSDSFFTISITILTALTLVFIKHYRGFKIHARPNTKTTYIIILFAILYTIERWIHIDEYTMYKFSYVNISYIDFLLGTLLIANLWQWYGYKRFILLQQNQKKGQGFIKDTVFKENNNGEYTLKQDKLGREQFTQKLKDFILNSKNKEQEGSLNIGLEGPWGSGKTYMLKQLNQELEVEAITIEFNPWRSINTENIISDFFHTLATELKRYDAGIQTNLLKYLNLILDSVDVKTGPFSFRFQNLEIRQKDLNKQIRKLAKPVIIFIDDLDRLDDKEIREVLKLIRNTADFTNTVFVSAFNEEYIKKALKEDNADKANDASYIEKIFQIIFHLPEIDENELIQDLEKLIIDNSKIIKLNFENDL